MNDLPSPPPIAPDTTPPPDADYWVDLIKVYLPGSDTPIHDYVNELLAAARAEGWNEALDSYIKTLYSDTDGYDGMTLKSHANLADSLKRPTPESRDAGKGERLKR